MSSFAAFAAVAREKKTAQPARSIRGCLSWLVTYAEKAITKPAVHFEPAAIETIDAIGEHLAGESKLPMPVLDFFFAVTLAGALLKHAATTPGTDSATRLQCLIATLLPLVRVDLGRIVELERNRE